MKTEQSLPQTNEIRVNAKGRRHWTKKEDEILRRSIDRFGHQWLQVANQLKNRNPSQCAQRWKRIKPDFLKSRKRWTEEEDQLLLKLIDLYHQNWQKVAKTLGGRTSKQIRERYLNKLNPKINHSPFTEKEDKIIIKAYLSIGSKWSRIQELLDGRPENMIKNRFYSYLRQKHFNIKNPYYHIPNQESPSTPEPIICKTEDNTKEEIQIKIEDSLPTITQQLCPIIFVYPLPQIGYYVPIVQ